jgi:cysteine desulfurase
VLGNIHDRLGYITMFSFLYVAADELVDELGRRGWSVASGSACTSETERPLHVLQAIGALTHGNLRISLPPEATAEQIEDFADDLVETVARIRQAAGL